MLLEVACFNPASAVIAANNGAGRIEFCADYASGGVTPSVEDFIEIRKKVSVPIFVMLHPRKGFYSYNTREFEMMKNQMQTFKRAKADGFVFGCMYNKQDINFTQNKALVDLAGGLPCTFHRAFDEMEDKDEAMEKIIRAGFQRVLTSGKPGKAIENLSLLKKLHDTYSNQIRILPGGGIRTSNVAELLSTHAFDEIHSACILTGDRADPTEVKQLASYQV